VKRADDVEITWERDMRTYAQLFAELKAADDGWECVGPQPSSRIDEVEAKYSIKLPVSFREYLVELGGMDFCDAHYTSIDDDYLDDVDGFMGNTHLIRSQVEMPDSDTFRDFLDSVVREWTSNVTPGE